MTIPYLHPLVVHFPIAFLILGGLAALVWGATTLGVARQMALVLMLLGSIGAVVARQTGEALEHDVEGEPSVERFVEDHEAAGNWALGLGLVATGLLVWAEVRARRAEAPKEGWPLRFAVALVALGAAAAVARTGHLGGLMVWGVSAAPSPAATE